MKENNGNKREFITPTAELMMLAENDIVTTSGNGFEGEWEEFANP